jgi:hypothetical protein
MSDEPIQEGFDVFVHDGDKTFGTVRRVSPHGRRELLIYVENAGEFTVPLSAIDSVHADKVILNCDRLEQRLRQAIGHAHDSEDPRI